jgi:uncharacterized membrane protein (DUF441 family)
MSLTFKETPKNITIDAADNLSNRRVFLNAVAPVYFLSFSLLRCYVETAILADQSAFSYYVALHHTLWFATTILIIILLMNFILKVPIMRLLWVMYGITLVAIPLFYAMVTGENLRLEYLRGSFSEIISYIATFCWTYLRNRPLTMELLIIFFSMFAVGYAYTKSLYRAIFLAVSVHIAGNIFAIHWVGPIPYAKSVFTFRTQWSPHQFMSVFWLYGLTIVAVLFIWRAGWFGIKRSWIYSALAAASIWVVQVIIFKTTGWFNRPFDSLTAGLPAVTLAFLLVRLFSSERATTFGRALATMSAIFLIQLAVMGPIYFNIIKANSLPQ